MANIGYLDNAGHASLAGVRAPQQLLPAGAPAFHGAPQPAQPPRMQAVPTRPPTRVVGVPGQPSAPGRVPGPVRPSRGQAF